MATLKYSNNDGYFITEYDSNFQIKNITLDLNKDDEKVAVQIDDSYTYQKDGDKYTYNVNSITGIVENYSIEYVEGNSSNKFNYSGLGVLQNSVYTQGVKTTTSTYANEILTTTTTSFDFTGKELKPGDYYEVVEGEGTDKITTKYYVVDQVKVTEYSVESTGSDTDTIEGTQSIYKNTTTYNKDGIVIREIGSNKLVDSTTGNVLNDVAYTTDINDSGYTESYTRNGLEGKGSLLTKFDKNGEKITETFHSESKYEDEGKKITNIYENIIKYDLNGKVISDSGKSTSTYIDVEILKTLDESTWLTADTFADDKVTLTGHTEQNSSKDENGNEDSSTITFDLNGRILSSQGKNTYLETWNDNRKIISTFSSESIWDASHTKIIGNKGSNESKDSNGLVIDKQEYSSEDIYNGFGQLTGHINKSKAGQTGDSYSETEYTADWKVIKSKSGDTATYIDENSVTHTDKSTYEIIDSTITSTWENIVGDSKYIGKSVTKYKDSDRTVIETTTITENGKITVYDPDFKVINTSIDITGLGNGTLDKNGLMVYKITDVNGDSTEYYLKDGILDHYNTTSKSSDSQDDNTVIYENITNYNAKSIIVGNSGTITTKDKEDKVIEISTYNTHDNFDETGQLIGHSVKNTSGEDNYSESEYTADWQLISSKYKNVVTYQEGDTDTITSSINSSTTNSNGSISSDSLEEVLVKKSTAIILQRNSINSTITNPDGTVIFTGNSLDEISVDNGNRTESREVQDNTGYVLTSKVITDKDGNLLSSEDSEKWVDQIDEDGTEHFIEESDSIKVEENGTRTERIINNNDSTGNKFTSSVVTDSNGLIVSEESTSITVDAESKWTETSINKHDSEGNTLISVTIIDSTDHIVSKVSDSITVANGNRTESREVSDNTDYVLTSTVVKDNVNGNLLSSEDSEKWVDQIDEDGTEHFIEESYKVTVDATIGNRTEIIINNNDSTGTKFTSTVVTDKDGKILSEESTSIIVDAESKWTETSIDNHDLAGNVLTSITIADSNNEIVSKVSDSISISVENNNRTESREVRDNTGYVLTSTVVTDKDGNLLSSEDSEKWIDQIDEDGVTKHFIEESNKVTFANGNRTEIIINNNDSTGTKFTSTVVTDKDGKILSEESTSIIVDAESKWTETSIDNHDLAGNVLTSITIADSNNEIVSKVSDSISISVENNNRTESREVRDNTGYVLTSTVVTDKDGNLLSSEDSEKWIDQIDEDGVTKHFIEESNKVTFANGNRTEIIINNNDSTGTKFTSTVVTDKDGKILSEESTSIIVDAESKWTETSIDNHDLAGNVLTSITIADSNNEIVSKVSDSISISVENNNRTESREVRDNTGYVLTSTVVTDKDGNLLSSEDSEKWIDQIDEDGVTKHFIEESNKVTFANGNRTEIIINNNDSTGTKFTSTVVTDKDGKILSEESTSITVETVAPLMISAAVSTDGLKLVITYSEPLTGIPEAADYAITGLNPVIVSSVVLGTGVDSNKVILTLSEVIPNGAPLGNLVYTTSAGSVEDSIKDTATPANPAPTQTLATITNASIIDMVPPMLVVASQAIKNTANAVIQSSEVGDAYLINASLAQPTTKALADALVSAASGAGIHNAIKGLVNTASVETNIAATGLIDGEYKVYAVDAVGNLSSAATNTIKVDTTAPSAAEITYDVINTAGGNFTLNFSEPLRSLGTPSVADAESGSLTSANLGTAVGLMAGNGLSVLFTKASGTFEAGDIITLTGVTDLAGNNATLTFTLV